MKWRKYLPSAQFSVLAVSLLCSIGLVFAADFVTKSKAPPQLSAADQGDLADTVQNADWQKDLNDIQAQSGTSLPQPPDPATVDAMRQAAQDGNNLTQNIGRTLLVNLATAKAQGMGDDVPTQDAIVSQALSLVPATPTKQYTQDDLTVVADTQDSKHTYGNQLMATLNAHPNASMKQTFMDFSAAGDNHDPAPLKDLAHIEADYRALTKDLAAIPVPQTLVPLHLQILNEFSQISETYPGMEMGLDDPVRGITSFQQYKTLTDEALRVFTNISQIFNKDGILFTKDEPGAAWANVLSGQQ